MERQPQWLNGVPEIKPPTINTFVQLVNVLFKSLDARLNVNMSNYKEEIIKWLKILHYPGQINSSLLKTGNCDIL